MKKNIKTQISAFIICICVIIAFYIYIARVRKFRLIEGRVTLQNCSIQKYNEIPHQVNLISPEHGSACFNLIKTHYILRDKKIIFRLVAQDVEVKKNVSLNQYYIKNSKSKVRQEIIKKLNLKKNTIIKIDFDDFQLSN